MCSKTKMYALIILIIVLLILGLTYEGGYLNKYLSPKYKKNVPLKYGSNLLNKQANFAMLSTPFMSQPLTYAFDDGISADPNCGGWAPCVGN